MILISHTENTLFEDIDFTFELDDVYRSTSYRLSHSAKMEILRTLGDSAFILLDHYMSVAELVDLSVSDAFIAEQLEWTIDKVQEVQKLLKDSGWFHKSAVIGHDGIERISYCLGKTSVRVAKSFFREPTPLVYP